MKESLKAIGGYNPDQASMSILANFESENTHCVFDGDSLIGFYVLITNDDHWLLNHLYIHPECQGKGAGSQIVGRIKDISMPSRLPIRLAALKPGESNKFYKKTACP